MINLNALQIFCDLVETGSFSRTADKNFVSQSAVSQRLRALERDYGQTLLDRGQGRGLVRPTEAGQTFYTQGLRGLSDDVAGTVRVATVYSVGLHALPPRLKPFLAAHPRVNVHLEYRRTDSVYQDVMAGTADIGIVACPAPRRGVEVIPFGSEAMTLICAPENPFARLEFVRLAQLDGAPFIAFDTDIPTRRLVDDHLRAAGAQVRIVTSYDNIETIKNLVEIGSGVSLVPADTVRQEVRAGDLAAIPFSPDEAFQRPTGLLLKKSGARRAAVLAFVAAMRA